MLAGTGRLSVKSEYTAGITAVSLVETATSDNLEEWTAWQILGSGGELQSPNQRYICYRGTLTTTDTARTPRLLEIQLHDIPKPPYERLGFARPVVLDGNGAWGAVLENAYDIVVTSEVNGADTLEFKLPFGDSKRSMLDRDGMTFASVNGGREYVESYGYTNEVRIFHARLLKLYQSLSDVGICQYASCGLHLAPDFLCAVCHGSVRSDEV